MQALHTPCRATRPPFAPCAVSYKPTFNTSRRRVVSVSSGLLQGGYITSDSGDLLSDVYGGYEASAGWTTDEETGVSRRFDLVLQQQRPASAVTSPTLVTVLPEHLKRSILDNALVLIDKPKEWTAMDTVNAVRFSTKAKKAGHLGVLDPIASGLLIVALNRATELSPAFKGLEKRYTGVIRLGSATNTYDASGKVTDSLPWQHITDDEIEREAAVLTGELMLCPPMFSSYKYQGKPLYKLAERGMVVELEPQPVHVSQFKAWREPGSRDVQFLLDLEQNTFVRTIAHEFGRRLGSCSHLAELRREAVGEFSVGQAWNMDVFQNMAKKYAKGFRR